MKLKSLLAALAAVLSCQQAHGQATILPPGETCFSANVGINGMVGLLGSITGGSGYTNGTYGGVALTGGSGSNATANITVSGGVVTSVTILNPGAQYVTGDVLSAPAASIGGTGSGFSVPVASTAINSSLAGGSVGFYIPATQTYKQTWQDSGETVLNQNPVPLDANGCAVVYGAGIYRMIVQDSLGNTVYDKLTASTGPAGLFWAGTAGGTPNAITITDTNFALQDGATIQFRALSKNTGPTTLTVSGNSPIAIVKDTSSGPSALSGGEIGSGNLPMVTYDQPNNEFHIVNPSATASSVASTTITPPQGYLNLVGQASGDVIQTGDVIGATTIYYSPFVGSIVPIFNGTVFVSTQISELTLNLTAAGSTSNTIQDACIFSNNGVPTLVLGPSWTTVSAGSGNRGTGAGTAQLTRLQGIWVNAVQIVGYNGGASYTIPASQCTYVGSVYIDSSAGQVSAYRTWGQSRKWGIWNAYNRQRIVMQEGDSTASWNYTGGARAANGNSANSITVFSGLPEEPVSTSYTSLLGATINNSTVQGAIGIGYNSTSSISGTQGFGSLTTSSTAGSNSYSITLNAEFEAAPSIGINVITALENGTGASAATWTGGVSHMLLLAKYRG